MEQQRATAAMENKNCSAAAAAGMMVKVPADCCESIGSRLRASDSLDLLQQACNLWSQLENYIKWVGMVEGG